MTTQFSSTIAVRSKPRHGDVRRASEALHIVQQRLALVQPIPGRVRQEWLDLPIVIFIFPMFNFMFSCFVLCVWVLALRGRRGFERRQGEGLRLAKGISVLLTDPREGVSLSFTAKILQCEKLLHLSKHSSKLLRET
jgi:hypothetical protein